MKTQNDIIENNKLIAEFMGVKPRDNSNWFGGYELHKAGLPFACGAMGNGTDELKFHTSWDWLMPVIEKIDSMLADGEFLFIDYKEAYIDLYCPSWIFPDYKGDSFTISGSGQTKIEAVYNCVMEFIAWYNDNK